MYCSIDGMWRRRIHTHETCSACDNITIAIHWSRPLSRRIINTIESCCPLSFDSLFLFSSAQCRGRFSLFGRLAKSRKCNIAIFYGDNKPTMKWVRMEVRYIHRLYVQYYLILCVTSFLYDRTNNSNSSNQNVSADDWNKFNYINLLDRKTPTDWNFIKCWILYYIFWMSGGGIVRIGLQTSWQCRMMLCVLSDLPTDFTKTSSLNTPKLTRLNEQWLSMIMPMP